MKFGIIKYINADRNHGYVVEIDKTLGLSSNILRQRDNAIYFDYQPDKITFEKDELISFELEKEKRGKENAKIEKIKWFGVVTSLQNINILNPAMDMEIVGMESYFELGTILSFTLYFKNVRLRLVPNTSLLTSEILSQETNNDLYKLQDNYSNAKTAKINRIALDWHECVTNEQAQLYKSAFLIELNEIDEAYDNLKDIKGNDLTKSYSTLKIYGKSIDYEINIEKIFKKWEKDNFNPAYFFSIEDFEDIFTFIQTYKFRFSTLHKYLNAFELIDKKVALDFLEIVLNNHAYIIHDSDLENWKILTYYPDYLDKILPYVTDSVRFDLWLNGKVKGISADIINRVYVTTINKGITDLRNRIQEKVIDFEQRNEFSDDLKFDLWLKDGQFPPSVQVIEKQYWPLDPSTVNPEIDKILDLSKSLTDKQEASNQFKFELWLNGAMEAINVSIINENYKEGHNQELLQKIEELTINSSFRNDFRDSLKLNLWLKDGQFPPSIQIIEKQYWLLKEEKSTNNNGVDKILDLSKSLTDKQEASDQFKFELWLNGVIESIDISIINEHYKAGSSKALLCKVEALTINSTFRDDLRDYLKFNLWLQDGQFPPPPDFIENKYRSTQNVQIINLLLKTTGLSGYSDTFKFELWKSNDELSIEQLGLSISDFEKQFWERHKEQTTSTICEFLKQTIDRLSLEELLLFNKWTKVIKLRVEKKLTEYITSLFQVFCFDVEIREDKLTEVCFLDSSLEVYTNDIINNFFKENFQKADLVIGHNIIEFDLKQITKYGVKSIEKTAVWDTLQVEAMLSPTRKSYALSTKHNAKDDTLLTFDLFLHQVCRLLTLEQSIFEDFAVFLPHNAVIVLNDFRTKIVNDKQKNLLSNLFNKVYYKLSVPSPIVLKITQAINQSRSDNTILQIPYGLSKVMTEVINDFPKMTSLFESNERQPLLQNNISFEKIQTLKTEHFAFASVSFALQQNNNLLLFEQLSPYIKRCIIGELELEQITIAPTKTQFQEKLQGIIYGDQYHLMKFKQFIPSNAAFINIFEDISIWKDKVFIQKMTFDEVKSLPNGSTIWTKFSGGQGFAEMDETMKQSNGLKQKLSKMWIEKVDFDTFYIWGKTNDDIKQFIPFSNCIDIEIPTSNIKTSFVTISQHSLNGINQIRLNATTAYRDKYWHFQSKIIEELIAQNTLPIVWLIHETLSNEIDLLQQYFRKKGFYIPNASASLSRQIELLAKYHKTNKLLILDFKQLETITAVSHFPLRYIIDNLKVEETYFLSNNTNKKTTIEQESDTETDNDDKSSDENDATIKTESKAFRNDIEALLDLTKPYFQFLQFIIQSNNKNNILYCIDNHFDSYRSVVKRWNIESKSLHLWSSKNIFDYELSQLHQYFPTSIDKKIDWKYDEAKRIISKVFIGGHPFYDEQIPYLNSILEAKENLLVSLPTGGGKSVLFQGPALYRSSLTNKLTIVVTPLKALMEDQVIELQELGFWNSVDYINGDRSLEIDHIYKKIAGGELNMIYVTPERFRSRSFERALKCRLQQNGGFEYIVFDEAHCISQWGNEFRPDYHNGAKKAYQIKKTATIDFPILLFSATVSDQILEEFQQKFQ